jgi:signal transduction histidine kinase
VTGLPIRLRLTLAFAVAMAALLGVMSVFVYHRVGAALLGSVDQTLRSQATEAASHLRQNEPGLTDRDVGGGTTLAQLLRPDGTVVRSSRPSLAPLLRPREVASVPPGGSLHRSVQLRSPAGDWRLLAVRPTGMPGVLVVARSLEPREESLSRILRELLVAAPVALVLASLFGYGLASAALRPVEAMRRRAASVTADSPTRLPVPRSRDELSRLAETLNEMLERLHASLEHERRFVADASHELRTPLALLRTELELALRRPRTARELRVALQSAFDETERLTRLAEDLLLMARGDRGPLPLQREPLELDGVLETVAARFERQADAAGAAISTSDSQLLLDADPARLEQALANLVDNAIRYGGHRIELTALVRDGEAEVHVLDDGPGFPEAFIDRAFDRFSRADEARGSGGTGLGLSIVKLIADAHGGAAGVANRPGGGADGWFSVPLAQVEEALARPAALLS